MLDNALKFSIGQVRRVISIFAETTGSGIRYCIKDTGIGFNEAYND